MPTLARTQSPHRTSMPSPRRRWLGEMPLKGISPRRMWENQSRFCIAVPPSPRACKRTPQGGSAIFDGKRAAEAALFSLSKTYFLTDCQRSKAPPRQANRARRRTGGTVGGGLRSKSKCFPEEKKRSAGNPGAFFSLLVPIMKKPPTIKTCVLTVGGFCAL